ncbi:single-stranded DNA-binding protein [Paenibacillus sp. 481]|uniref:single-stranded DNA-binding protein n=1 Tax=Paenibacillus sp. 481 TaxID=2835869 RepID=UPI001E2F727F|nr:single-stranded DNA-binding protein [Paenibacillus sp. 481]UHA75382.1 single-stranded DNA-binding protein [Paenibacillus sp. 481]
MLNRVILIGRLTRDPELRYTPAGVAVTQFTLAVDRPYSSQSGEREADFIPVVTWRQLAETCANYLRKGRLTAVEGRIQVRSYDNNEGKRVYVTEIIADNVRFLESNRDSGGMREDMGGGQGAPAPSSYGQNSQNSQGSQSGQPRGGSNNNYSRGPAADPFSDDGRPIDISDDDLPF